MNLGIVRAERKINVLLVERRVEERKGEERRGDR